MRASLIAVFLFASCADAEIVDRCLALEYYSKCMERRQWAKEYRDWCEAEGSIRAVRPKKDVDPLCGSW
jgi:hypothetical protein